MRHEVVIVNDPVTLYTDIYVYSGNHVGYYTNGRLDWYEVPVGTKPEQPTFKIDNGIWQMIMQKALGPTPQHHELEDAKRVRDRLLGMIEREWDARVEGK